LFGVPLAEGTPKFSCSPFFFVKCAAALHHFLAIVITDFCYIKGGFMEQLTIDTGLREYAVNGGPEHGGGVLRFNPSDPNVYSRFCTLQNQLQELEQQVQAQSPTGTDAIQLLAQADQRAKGLLAEVFGPGNDFDAMLGGTNLLAVAGNGERVITNLFAALEPTPETGARQCPGAKTTLAVQQAHATPAPPRVQV